MVFSSPCHAGDEPFTYPASWGGTGLMEIPTARIMPKDSWHFGVSQIDPLRTYYIGFSPMACLELQGRVTEYLHTSSIIEEQEKWQGYGNDKDKAIDLKLQFLPEGQYTPALALGIMDPHGTRLQGAQYIVASKQIYPFDFTVGMGNGRYGENALPAAGNGFKAELFSHPRDWWDDAQVFYGIQFAPSDKFALMVEYNPIKLEKYYKYGLDEGEHLKSRYNFGLRLRPWDWFDVDLSWQRGNTFGANVSMAFDIGQPLIPIVDIPYREEPVMQTSPLAERLTSILVHEGFSDIAVTQQGGELWVEAQNDVYFYTPKAVAVIIRSMSGILPEDVDQIHITLKQNGIPLTMFTTTRADMVEWYAERLTTGEYLHVAAYDTDVRRLRARHGMEKKAWDFGLEPVFQTFLNDPSGFFKYRVGAKGTAAWHPWKGGSLVGTLEGYPLNNISTDNEPLSIPVRSDIAEYEKSRLAVGRLMVDQIGKTKHELYGRISAGWLEIEYAGVDGEVAMPLWDGRIMVGISGSAVKKREPDTTLGIRHDDEVKDAYTTAFFNTRLNIPEIGVTVDLKAGRFLAGDKGTRITVAKFVHGVVIAGWYGITNTSDFDDEYNEGYRDKGIAVKIPLRLFEGHDSRTSYHYVLAPWTRDVAQDINHYNQLFDYIGRNTRVHLRQDAGEMQAQ